MSVTLRSVSYVPSSPNAFLIVLTCTPIFAIRGSSLSVQPVFPSAQARARPRHPDGTPGGSPPGGGRSSVGDAFGIEDPREGLRGADEVVGPGEPAEVVCGGQVRLHGEEPIEAVGGECTNRLPDPTVAL